MNKKLWSLLAAIGLAGSIYAAPAVLAAGEAAPAPPAAAVQTQERAGTLTTAPNYLDKDSDGVCDNYSEGEMLGRRTNGAPGRAEAGTGAQGTGEDFIDADKDGVCDNFAERTPLLKKDGTGNPEARGTGQGSGTKENFEDEGKDGVCDNFAKRTPLLKKDGTGNTGSQRRAGRGK